MGVDREGERDGDGGGQGSRQQTSGARYVIPSMNAIITRHL